MPAEIPTARPSFSSPALGSLTLALILHAIGLSAAAWVGFSVAPARDGGSDTFELRLAIPRPPPTPPEPAFAPPVTEVLEPVLPLPDDDFLAEPELITSEVWAEEEPEPAPLTTMEPPVEVVDLTPPDLLHLDLGFPARESPGASAPGAQSAGPDVASVGVFLGGAGGGQGGAGNSMGDSVGNGSGSHSGAIGGTGTANSAAPRAPRIRKATPLEVPSPSYPVLSRRLGEEGSVHCCAHISEKGLVTQVDVVESSGFPRLDEAAREALMHWRFEPWLVDDRPVCSTVLRWFTFQLNKKK